MTDASDDNPAQRGARPPAPYLCDIVGMLVRHWLPFTLFGLIVLAIAGAIGHSFGLPHLFRDDPQLLEYGWGALRNSPALWGSAAATLLLITILIGVFVNKRLRDERLGTTWRDLAWYVIWRGLPFEVLLLLAVAWRTYRAADRAEPLTLAVDLGEAALGIALGVGLALLVTTAMSLLYVRMDAWLGDTRLGRTSTGFLQRVTVQALSNNRSPDAAWVALYFFAGVLLVTLPFMIYEMIVPAVALCILLVWLVLGYFLLDALRPLVRHPAVLLVLLLYGVFSYDAFKNRFPGFVAADQGIDLYDCPLRLHDRQYSCEALRPPGAAAPEPQATRSLAGKAEGPSRASEVVARDQALDRRTWALLDAWRTRPAEGGPFERQTRSVTVPRRSGIEPAEPVDPRRHKLVVVTTSGGAYRAAFWTALVLDELVRTSARGHAIEGFADQIRLLTGASGGMVASAYFAALASPDGWSRADPPSIRQRLVADIRNARDRASRSAGRFKTGFPIDRDSLGPVAQQTLQRDAVRAMLMPFSSVLPESWLRWRNWGDRGLALEEQWATLDLSFRELEQGVAEGWRPWLILSPMIADTGQPMLISNVPVDPVLERVEGAAIDLFDLFPGQRDQLKVSTAVRMNASFPYISPAVSLPTVPKRRIVDAGYYDNYGVNAALAWLSQDGMLQYLRNNVAGVVVVQIRAYPTSSGVPQPDGDERPDFPLAPEWLTSPLTGVLAARSSSMLYRNNEQLKLFSAQFCDAFVQTVALENRARDQDIGMSWYLRPEGLEVMRTELGQEWNQREFDKLAAIWASDQRCAPASDRRPTTMRPSAPASVIPASARER